MDSTPLSRSFLVYAAVAALGFLVLYWSGVRGDYVTSITTAVVGFTAYLVFRLNQIQTTRDAAKTLILDIRNAEDAIAGLRANQSVAAWSKLEMTEQNWAKVKQQFIADLNTDEFAQFERFFRLWAGLLKAKQDIDGLTKALFECKVAYSNRLLIDLHEEENPLELERKRTLIIGRTNQEQWMFAPDALNASIAYFLNEAKPLTGTTGFAKLLGLANVKA